MRVIGTSARIYRLDVEETTAEFTMKAADKVKAFTRLRLPKKVTSCSAVDETGAEVAMSWIIMGLEDKSVGAVMKYFKQNHNGTCDMQVVKSVLDGLK